MPFWLACYSVILYSLEMLLQWFNANLAKQLIFAVAPKAMEIMSIDGYVTHVPKPLVNCFCRGFAEPAQMH